MPRRNKLRLGALALNKVIYSSMARTEYKTIAVGKWKNGFVSRESRHTISHKAAVASLSQRWSVIRSHPVHRRKGRMCIISPFDGVEAARPDLRYPSFSLTKL